MYFKQIAEIVNGTKTQTRRVCKPPKFTGMGVPIGGEYAIDVDGDKVIDHLGNRLSDKPIHAVYTITARGDRLKWQVGRKYAVSPGRGNPCALWCAETGRIWNEDWARENPMSIEWFRPLRFKLLKIRREPVWVISEEDAVAEGYPHLDWWNNLSTYPETNDLHPIPSVWYHDLWQSINGPKSWDTTGDVWVLTFEVVR